MPGSLQFLDRLLHFGMWCTNMTMDILQYYKVRLQYCSVLKRTTPVLLCTTKYYSCTILYYKVLLQYCTISQGELFSTVDLGCPSFGYLVTSFTTSFIPRSRPRSLPLQKACSQAAISKQCALNMIVWLKD